MSIRKNRMISVSYKTLITIWLLQELNDQVTNARDFIINYQCTSLQFCNMCLEHEILVQIFFTRSSVVSPCPGPRVEMVHPLSSLSQFSFLSCVNIVYEMSTSLGLRPRAGRHTHHHCACPSVPNMTSPEWSTLSFSLLCNQWLINVFKETC